MAPTQLWRHWLEAGPVQAAEMVNDYDIQVIPEYGNIGDYNKNARISIEKSNAPDIVFANTNSLLEWAAKGDIQPLENCRERYDQFDNIASELWLPATFDGHVWGIPVNIEIDMLFFNKEKLREVGWSETRIDLLPYQIAEGSYTLTDLGNTVQSAMNKGVIKPGFGFWIGNYGSTFGILYMAYEQEKVNNDLSVVIVEETAIYNTFDFYHTVVDSKFFHESFMRPNVTSSWSTRLLQNDAVMSGQVLFWRGRSDMWAQWMYDFENGSYSQDPTGFIGMAPFPTGVPGLGGHIRGAVNYYVLPTRSLTGNRYQDATCALLAKAISPEINIPQAYNSHYLSTLDSDITNTTYLGNPFLEAGWKFQKNIYLYRQPYESKYHPSFAYELTDFMDMVGFEEISAETATELSIEKLQNNLDSPNNERKIIIVKSVDD